MSILIPIHSQQSRIMHIRGCALQIYLLDWIFCIAKSKILDRLNIPLYHPIGNITVGRKPRSELDRSACYVSFRSRIRLFRLDHSFDWRGQKLPWGRLQQVVWRQFTQIPLLTYLGESNAI